MDLELELLALELLAQKLELEHLKHTVEDKLTLLEEVLEFMIEQELLELKLELEVLRHELELELGLVELFFKMEQEQERQEVERLTMELLMQAIFGPGPNQFERYTLTVV